MSKAGRRMIKNARAALKFSRLLRLFDMEDKEGTTTVFVSGKGKHLGTVHGQRFMGKLRGPRP